MEVTATVTRTFDAAHLLPSHDGQCANLHGHTYEIRVTVARGGGGLINDQGMVADFGDVKQCVDSAIEPLDHAYLNDTYPQPTAERMAIHLAGVIDERLRDCGVRVVRLRLQETPECYVEVEMP